MKLDRFLSEGGSTGLALCMPELLRDLNPDVVPGAPDRSEEEFDLEFYCEEELVGMAVYDLENEVFQIMTLEPTEWHTTADEDFMDMLCSTLASPVVTWYTGFSDGIIGSIFCTVDAYSMLVYKKEDGTYEADFVADPDAVEEVSDAEEEQEILFASDELREDRRSEDPGTQDSDHESGESDRNAA